MKRILASILLALSLICVTACGQDAAAASKAQVFQTLLSGLRFDGSTLSGGKVYFYSPGTTTAKAVYTTRAKTVEAANPYTLDSNGQATIYGDGVYDIKVTTSGGTQKAYWYNVALQDISIDTINASQYDSLNAAVTAIGSTPTLLDITTTLSVTGNVTVPSTLAIRVSKSGAIAQSTYNVTINGNFTAGLNTVFTGSGTITFGKGAVYEVFPEWWGAINGTHDQATLLPYVQKAVDSLPVDGSTPVLGGGRVVINPGFYLASSIKDLVIPTYVIVDDRGRSDHVNMYSGSTDVEYTVSGPTATSGSSSPTLRIHNQGVDGKRIPTLLFSRGRNETSYNSLLWSIQGSNDNSYASNVPAADFVLAGGQGASYITGTVTAEAASATVTGSGTSWTSDLIGGIFTVDSQTNAAAIVKSVESTTSLTLENIWSTYGGIDATGEAYEIEGGFWAGATTTDYRGRLVIGQNYTWLFNSGNYATGDASPRAVGRAGGAFAANLSYVMNGNRLKGGALNPSTLVKLENGAAGAGQVGHIYRSSDYAGDPTKTLYLDKATDALIVGEDVTPANYIGKFTELGYTGRRNATAVAAGGSVSGTVTPPIGTGSIVTYTVDGNLTIGEISTSDILVGQELTFVFTQGAAGSKTVAFHASFKTAGSTFTMTATAGKIDTITFVATSTSTWVEKSRAQNQ